MNIKYCFTSSVLVVLFLVIGLMLTPNTGQQTFAVADQNDNAGNKDPEFCEPGRGEGPFGSRKH